jgi:branched-chain amino acid transport system permease protein
MRQFFLAYNALFDIIILNCGLALSQYIVLRCGVFSLSTAGIASLGAYTAAIISLKLGINSAVIGLSFALLVGAIVSGLLSIPLARLRGIFQAIATLAFVQIVQSLTLYSESLTGGAMGLQGIPRLVDTWFLLGFLSICCYLMYSIGQGSIGRAFDTIRQEETVAVALGMSVVKYHTLAFAISGAIAGLTGGLIAYRQYALTPEDFGFPMLVSVLVFVVLGGQISPAGPIVGAIIMTLLPEIARPLAKYRLLVHGALLMAVIIYLPNGIVDTLLQRLNMTRLFKKTATIEKDSSHEQPAS